MASIETTHHDDHHSDGHHISEDSSRRTSYAASFWFVAIIVGLFIAALNFISAMGDDHGSGHGTEHAAEHGPNHPTMPTREATSTGTLHGETGIGRPTADTTQHTDTVRHDIEQDGNR